MTIIDGMLLSADYHQLTKYNRFKTIITSYNLLLSYLMHSPSPSLLPPFLNLKATPIDRPLPDTPCPPINPYLARSFASELPPQVEGIDVKAGLGGWKMMRALLHAKVEAERRLGEYLAQVEIGDGGGRGWNVEEEGIVQGNGQVINI